jgi:hypothetical protein
VQHRLLLLPALIVGMLIWAAPFANSRGTWSVRALDKAKNRSTPINTWRIG